MTCPKPHPWNAEHPKRRALPRRQSPTSSKQSTPEISVCTASCCCATAGSLRKRGGGRSRPELPHILYSLTKSFTSTAAGFAVGEGKLDLDDPVLKFFPGRPKNPSEHWQAMKVRHLLSMTTGHAEDPGAQVSQYPPSEWLRRIFETTVPYAPGTHFVYNSTASHLVSIIVQKLTGQTLVNYLRDRLFRPLGISRPYWETDPMGANWGGWGLYLAHGRDSALRADAAPARRVAGPTGHSGRVGGPGHSQASPQR